LFGGRNSKNVSRGRLALRTGPG